MVSLILLGPGTVGAVSCSCPYGGVYYPRIWTSRDGWLYDMCIVSFDTYTYYGYPAVCGTTTTTTSTTSTTTSTTSLQTRLTTVISKTSLGVQFSGAKVKVDRGYYLTPFSLPLEGRHTFTAPSTVTIEGMTYHFLRWEDQWRNVISRDVSMTSFTLGRTFYAVYEPPSYALTVYVKDTYTGRAVAGASVYLDSVFAGITDSRGAVVIQRVYAGWHYLGVRKYPTYIPYWRTVNIRANTFTVYLAPTG